MLGKLSSLLVLAIGVTWGASALAAPRIDAETALERSEGAIGRMTSEHQLIGADGQPMSLAQFRGKPLVISLIYTSCSSVCPVGTETLKEAVAEARRTLDSDSFQILTLGFDARNDTPRALSAFAGDHSIDRDPYWHVASASPAVLDVLLDELGFTYSYAAGGYEHVAQTTLLDKDGRVYRQVYGDIFPLPVFIEPMKEMVFGRMTRDFTPQALVDRLRFLCTVYDPRTGAYRTDYGIYIGITLGGLSLMIMGWMLWGMWRKTREAELAAAGKRQPKPKPAEVNS